MPTLLVASASAGHGALTCQTLLEVGSERAVTEAVRSLRCGWNTVCRSADVVGDWGRRPHVPSGGWAFQYVNPYYVDFGRYCRFRAS